MLHTIFKIRLLLGLVPLLGAVLWMGVDGGETYYEKPPSAVMSALSSAYVPTHILGSHVEGSRVTMPDGKTVVTALIDRNGAELMRFVTTVRADGTGSLVDTVVEGPTGRHAERAAEAMKSQAFTMSFMEKLADEHVAAAIEGRPFDMLAFNPMAKGLAQSMGYGEHIDAANAAGSTFSQADQADGANESGFADDSWVESSGEPMSDYETDGGWGE